MAPEVERFLDEGEPPVCIALGRGTEFGIRRLGAERFWSILLEALEMAEQRAILITGSHPGPATRRLSGQVLPLESVPYLDLFPRVGAVVHHAGAGTTGAVARSGVPCVAVPAAFDQFFWARQLARSGVGTTPLPMKHLRADALAHRICRAVGDSEIARRSREMAAEIAGQDGAVEAARLAERYLGSAPSGGAEVRPCGPLEDRTPGSGSMAPGAAEESAPRSRKAGCARVRAVRPPARPSPPPRQPAPSSCPRSRRCPRGGWG